MARKTSIVLIDDLDGGEAAETIAFALDRVNYEIDLSAEHAGELRAVLSPYAQKARRVADGSAADRPRVTRVFTGYDSKAVRAWAASRRVPVPARGRIPNSVLEQFRAAGN